MLPSTPGSTSAPGPQPGRGKRCTVDAKAAQGIFLLLSGAQGSPWTHLIEMVVRKEPTGYCFGDSRQTGEGWLCPVWGH